MARTDLRHPAGAPGPWFVDDRCIDCDAARQVAPGLIARNPGDGVSVFTRQPTTDDEVAMAWRAVLVCPTRSVGHETIRQPPPGVYPHHLGDGVHRLGHNARDSFGAHSYLVVRPGGNLLVDAPRWTQQLLGPIADLGGVDHLLLTHRDDVADADRYAERFGARVWIHEDDRAAAPYATDLVRGTDEVEVVPGVVGFPVPGHTRGSVLWHVDGRLLFSGDSLSWSPRQERLTAFRDACWYSWDAQTASLDRFARSGHRFDRLFCGHGWSHDAPAEVFHDHLVDLVARMPDRR
ncbi:4Fe-4S domain-containing protein [Nitriliruptor alkaliphilus]|uniref:4Fe-4S domain-containing protein n=1 Tax=Nitriliruptor alkaliphilus TaxID=427918 RepID=UPI0006990802|nr:ferredoxin [Nitriliruptor alkaliphilus]